MKARRKGSIYKEPGCATWTIAYRRDGKRIREYTGFEDFNAAQQRLAQRLAQSARGEMIDTGRGPTCADLWEGLERYYRINGRKTGNVLPCRWKHLRPVFGNIAAGQVTFDRLEQYVDSRLVEKASNATINRETSLLRRMLTLGKIPLPGFEHLPEKTSGWDSWRIRTFPGWQQRLSELWLRTLLEVAYSYGWRRGELLGLRVGQVDFNARTIRLDVGQTKNDEGREVVMTDTIYELLVQ
jgi:integrase